MKKSEFNKSLRIFSSECQYCHCIAWQIGKSSRCLISGIALRDSIQASCSESLSAIMESFLAITSLPLPSSPLLSSTAQIAACRAAFPDSRYRWRKNNFCPSKFQGLYNSCCRTSLQFHFLPQ